ncbi:hypothetical protein LINPERHAP1_LOCUS23258, partial [Linum perenne]
SSPPRRTLCRPPTRSYPCRPHRRVDPISSLNMIFHGALTNMFLDQQKSTIAYVAELDRRLQGTET